MVYRTDLSGNVRAVSDGAHVELWEGSLAELQAMTRADRSGSGDSDTPTR